MPRVSSIPPILISALLAAAPAAAGEPERLPYRELGWSEREAAAHLLDRFTYGPRPGQIDEVVAQGLESWLEEQLAANLPDTLLERRLDRFSSLGLTGRQIARTYPPPGRFLLEARQAGVLPGDVDPQAFGDLPERERRELRSRLMAFAREQGYRPQRDLYAELQAQKLYRAVYSENQLQEVLTDFWFNHFNVSVTDNQARVHVLSYERDAIRPHVFGPFRDLLGATARHPAMLLYLDNAQSTAMEGAPTTFDPRRVARRGGRGRGGFGRGGFGGRPRGDRPAARQRPRGLNENYARELLELHTLGVDGGYTQEDVIEAARAFTGWTVIPTGPMGERVAGRLAQVRRMGGAGFVTDGDFLFRADAHDAGRKKVLGKTLPAGRGIEDGEEVLDLVATHPSTARHLASKLAVRFASDQPPAALVDRLAGVFTATGGDLAATVRALAYSEELWDPEIRRAKIKSPFELAASALRALDAELWSPRRTVEWISRMGQPLYAYQAPTGYPDRAQNWVNTGSLLSRMSFGMELAGGEVLGARLDLAALNGHREPESREEALETYLRLLLPEREVEETARQLVPMLAEPELVARIDGMEAIEPAPQADPLGGPGPDPFDGLLPEEGEEEPSGGAADAPVALEQVVGLILGSPEFQRR